MKKVLLIVAFVGAVGLLSGCSSTNQSGGFDNADSATFEKADAGQLDDIGNPPVPPEPTE